MNSRNWLRTAASRSAESLTSAAKPLSTTLLIAAGSASVAAAASNRNSNASAICFLYGFKNGNNAARGRKLRADADATVEVPPAAAADAFNVPADVGASFISSTAESVSRIPSSRDNRAQ